MYTTKQIEKGLELAAQWFEGWNIEALGADQLLECIEKANR